MKPQTPPPVVSAPALVPGTPYPHAQAAPKKRVSIVLVVLGIVGALIFVDNVLGQLHDATGVNVNGRELSQSESNNSVRDIAQMTKGVRTGDPHSIKTDYVPDTELGRRFRDILLSAQKINDDYMNAIAESKSPDYMSPKQLGSASGRKDARRIHNDYETATSQYEKSTNAYLQKLDAFISETTGKSLPDLPLTNDENAEIAKLEADESKSIDKMLDFVDSAQPTYDAKTNKLRFATANDVQTYRSIAADIFDKQHALYARKKAILESRQKRINWAVNDLKSRLQS